MSNIILLDAKGKELSGKSAKPSILIFNGLRVDVRKRDAKPHAAAMEECETNDLLGLKWRSATVREIFAMADITNPKGPFPKRLFPHFPAYGWLWTSDPYAREPDAASPVYAWGVNLDGGGAFVDDRSGDGLALPVSPLASPSGQ